jgi:hypothetical protein
MGIMTVRDAKDLADIGAKAALLADGGPSPRARSSSRKAC